MPRILEPGTWQEREVSEETIRQLVDSPQGGQVFKPAHDGAANMRLWDAVDAAWGPVLPDYQAMFSLRMVVYKCSACRFTTAFEGGVEKHLTKIKENAQQHTGASLKEAMDARGEPYTVCTGCGGSFRLRKLQGQRHLQEIREAPKVHGTVEEVTMKRYSIDPSGPVVLKRRPILNGKPTEVTTGPSASLVEGSSPGRKRKRHRRRSKEPASG